jgi:hypothetical protein
VTVSRGTLSTSGVVDEAVRSVVRTAAPWLGVLWLTALPFRLMQVYMVREVLALGTGSRRYGDYLFGIAVVTLGAFVVTLLGRLVYVRAVHLSVEQGRSPGLEGARVRPSGVVSCLYVTFLIEMIFVPVVGMSAAAMVAFLGEIASNAPPMLLLAVPICCAGSVAVLSPFLLVLGLAAATAHLVDRPGLLRPFRELAAANASKRTLVGLVFVFACAIVIAWVNLYFCAHAALWMAQGLSGEGLEVWERLLRPYENFPLVPAQPLTALMLYVGTCMAVEPFWLAALAVYVYRLKMRETGDDLRRWFLRLRGTPRRGSAPAGGGAR